LTKRGRTSPSTTHGFWRIVPIATMPASPPLMMGVPASIPNTPMFVIVIVPPCWSAGLVLPSRAVIVRRSSARARSRMLRSWASLMFGTRRPRGVAAAMPRLT